MTSYRGNKHPNCNPKLVRVGVLDYTTRTIGPNRRSIRPFTVLATSLACPQTVKYSIRLTMSVPWRACAHITRLSVLTSFMITEHASACKHQDLYVRVYLYEHVVCVCARVHVHVCACKFQTAREGIPDKNEPRFSDQAYISAAVSGIIKRYHNATKNEEREMVYLNVCVSTCSYACVASLL
jgi:hypothetical protein